MVRFIFEIDLSREDTVRYANIQKTANKMQLKPLSIMIHGLTSIYLLCGIYCEPGIYGLFLQM
jgi:hypothetical protein